MNRYRGGGVSKTKVRDIKLPTTKKRTKCHKKKSVPKSYSTDGTSKEDGCFDEMEPSVYQGAGPFDRNLYEFEDNVAELLFDADVYYPLLGKSSTNSSLVAKRCINFQSSDTL